MAVLTDPIALANGCILPAGTRGAIVLVHGDGVAYEVEFINPFHAVVTVEAEHLVEAEPA